MTSHLSHVMTLANSIIGVSVLAMPFCFKQCGIVLAIAVLLLCSVLSRLACHFLIKSAVMSRRRNFEFLAFHAFGPMGKFLVELFIIGFLLGTCIAFYVVIGDLGPQIIGKMLNKNPEDIRTSFLLTTGALIVFPLGLLKNIDSLANICTATIGFYICLVLKVMIDSTKHIFSGDWYDNVNYWRPAGILQCLPIFSMALFCQTQLFEIYESILNVSLEKMNHVVRGALNICTMVYLCVGFFGYVAFCTESFSGNILMVLEPSATSDMIKIGFVLSVVFSFPLVIFPCRASLNSLLFRRVQTHEPVNNYIPEIRFRCLTLTIVTVALITGIFMPNIEFVLGLVGSTIGVMICLILPTTFFIVISAKNTNERLLAQVISFVGIWIMILGTYANLYAMEEASTSKINLNTGKPILQISNIELNLLKSNDELLLPKAPLVPVIQQENIGILQPNFKIDIEKVPDMMSIPREPVPPPKDKPKPVEKVVTEKSEIISKPLDTGETIISPQEKTELVEAKIKQDEQANEILINSEVKKNEDAGVSHVTGKLNLETNDDTRQDHFLKKLEEHKTDIRKLIEEQKVLLQDIEHHKEELEMEKRKRLMYQEPVQKESHSKDQNDLSKNKREKNDEIRQKLEANTEIPRVNSDINLKETRKNIDNTIEAQISLNASSGKILNSTNSSADSMNITLIESRGPIVNVLTNWTVTRKISDMISKNEKNQSQRTINRDQTPETKKTIYHQLPIPLKLINQTKDKEKESKMPDAIGGGREKRNVQHPQLKMNESTGDDTNPLESHLQRDLKSLECS
ncbi:putative sodium-coupled neutral amino acid transporter 10 isoform X1 [Fopius arisanus]|uniref:Sodium-coupled neutral amino acid transporter 10 isoform X1 n=2 Tax=Fopius arisanus TaxID=64838 RepID=A0A9R1TL29_9HYME|nr:PREDICTED: putative sodium-coupled neutral amino acid transporter 10 isoform X1 [Fopius arisanus]XP_011311170.1 PREDICTED: putative sodium-coupled neutral amino acid transporter 10 isoform X1 [Fopius arisanus]